MRPLNVRGQGLGRGWGRHTLSPLPPSLSLFFSPRSVVGWPVGPCVGPRLRSVFLALAAPASVPCPSARFGRTRGLARGDLRIPPWGHFRGGGWAFLLPAWMASWLGPVFFVFGLCAGRGAEVLRLVRSFAASTLVYPMAWQSAERAWAGTGEWAGATNPVAAAVSAAAAQLPLEIQASAQNQHVIEPPWRDGGRGWGGVCRRCRCRQSSIWTHTFGRTFGHTEGTLRHFGMSIGTAVRVAGSLDPDRLLRGFGRRRASYYYQVNSVPYRCYTVHVYYLACD